MKYEGAIVLFVILLIIFIICHIIGINSVIQGNCPLCGGRVKYEGIVVRDGESYYRYRCDECPWVADTYFKYRR